MKSTIAIAAAFLLAGPAWSAEWAWLEFDGGPVGEATDAAHSGWMVINGYRLDGELTTGEPGAFDLEKPVDKASPKLLEACISGKVFPVGRLDVAQPGSDGTPDVLARIELLEVVVTAIDSEGGVAGAVDRFTLSFEEIRFSYYVPGTAQGEGWFANVNFETGEATQGAIGGNPDPQPTWFTASLRRSPENPDELRLSWPSTPGTSYVVQWSPDLITPFVTRQSITADGASTHIDFPIEGTMGFFRIALP